MALALVVLGVIVSAVFPPRSEAASSPVHCPEWSLPYDRWVPLPGSGGLHFTSASVFNGTPCAFIGATANGDVLVTRDTGSHWRRVASFGGQVTEIVTEHLASGTAFVLMAPGAKPSVTSTPAASGLYVTHDFGASFLPVPQFAGLDVTALAGAPNGPGILFATASPLGSIAKAPAAMYRSTDGGQSWIPLPAPAGLTATDIAVGEQSSQEVWVSTRADPARAAGLWLSTNGGTTFQNARSATATDLDVANVPGQGDRLDAATAHGILQTTDTGRSFRALQAGQSIVAVRHEPRFPEVLMAVLGGIPERSLDGGKTFHAANLHPSSGCDAGLSRDDGSPATFVLDLGGCSSAGAYVYRSSGRDLLGLGGSSGSGSGSGGGGPSTGLLTALPMQVLARVPTPVPAGTLSDVAFDGSRLYYTADDTYRTNRIYMMSPTGVNLGSIVPTVYPTQAQRRVFGQGGGNHTYHPYGWALSYDGTDNVLWVIDYGQAGAGIYRVDPVTGAAKFAFLLKGQLGAALNSLTFDPSLRELRANSEFTPKMYEIDPRGGGISKRCKMPDPAGYTNTRFTAAASVAAGDGTMYVEAEDDQHLFHISRDCRILEAYSHEPFQEQQENDQIACDTVTFGRPAIWMHEDLPFLGSSMIAFAVPDGYCPIPSQVRLVPSKIVTHSGVPGRVCGVLEIGAYLHPVANMEVHFFIGGRFIGAAITNAAGLACVPYTPNQGPGSRLPMKAAFFGTSDYLPSSAPGQLDLLGVPAAVVPPVVAAVAAAQQPPPPPAPPVAVTQPNPNPAPGPGTAPQPQPQPQSNPQPQGQGQPQGAMATQKQEQPQTAFARAANEAAPNEEYAMSDARRDPLGAARIPIFGGAALAAAFGCVALVRRRSVAHARASSGVGRSAGIAPIPGN